MVAHAPKGSGHGAVRYRSAGAVDGGKYMNMRFHAVVVRIHGHEVRGVGVDSETRCAHYGTERDVVAMKFGCCETYVPCVRCHESVADHDAEPWPTARTDEPAVLCGVCGFEMTPSEYVARSSCPECAAAFNPGCEAHYHRYFEWIDDA